MKTLAMDTAWQNLVVVLMEDGEIVNSLAMEAFKKQSEELFPALEKLLNESGWKLGDVDEVLITEGPGSYTGLRIAMTAAKVLASQGHKKLKTITTMQLYAGTAPAANVLLDARGGRAYTAHVENGEVTDMEILPVEEARKFVEENPGILYGQGSLIGLQEESSDFAQNFADLLPLAKEVEEIDTLVPLYLKESSSYKV